MKDNDSLATFQTSLEEILQQGARRLLQQAIENEVDEFIKASKNNGHSTGVKRNGYLPERQIQTGIGQMTVKKPRVRGTAFTSAILPPYMRRTPSIETLIPAMYLKGISTNGMEEALEAILGEQAKGLSPTNIVRLKKLWEHEYEEWGKRDLSDKEYVYV